MRLSSERCFRAVAALALIASHSEMPDSEDLREEAAASYPRLTCAPSLKCVTNDIYLVLIGQLVDR